MLRNDDRRFAYERRSLLPTRLKINSFAFQLVKYYVNVVFE